MDIRQIDRFDDAQLRPSWELGKVVDEYQRPWSWYWTWESACAALRVENKQSERVLLGAFDGTDLVGSGHVVFPLLDNTHAAFGGVAVPPDRRRRGVGTALADALEERVAQRRRCTFMTEVLVGVDETDSPGMAFAERRGYEVGVSDGLKLVDLVETEPTWAALAAETAPHHEGYTLVSWSDEMPDDIVDSYCALATTFLVEAPMGTMDVEEEKWSRERVRDDERMRREAGRHMLGTAAVASDGTVAGFTEVVVSKFSPERGFQSGTIVAPAHRGHRLGLAVKLANHASVRAAFPECRRLMTGNAGVNEHMNAVNDSLGYRLVEYCNEIQKKL